MAVKNGLPATDFSKMNRDYIRNVAEGETVKDGLPATDFSRMNREYIKAVVEESGGGGGGDITVESLTVTENDTYTAPEGKAYSPVIVNVEGGGGESDYTTVTITLVNTTQNQLTEYIPYLDTEYNCITSVITLASNDSAEYPAVLYKGELFCEIIAPNSFTVSGDITKEGLSNVIINGAGTITIS